ncbi:MAG: lysine--tRNA ligase [Alphaproteobacteria bacterium]|nr:lysine--tRNA ligase [Alphaproteobacteria bacterium]NDG04663.1 lysine--tRNA ligase [Alphaproteobacteria bacterium]
MTDKTIAMQAKAWPFEEARKLVARYAHKPPAKGYVLFETGYGPSGLPHIGTFGEVVRTTMVRHAFTLMSDIPTRLICFSDDMDGLRKVPENVPNKDMLRDCLGKPLTQVPDPFGTHDSFGAHNNARLRSFLDQFGFEYEFKSSTAAYQGGEFDATLLKVLEKYDEMMEVMLATLGEERQQTYSPFLPISPKTGRVLQVPVLERNLKTGTIIFEDEDDTKTEVPVTGGYCKLQWKPDWAMRWTALGVDYEMSGKDLDSSFEAGGKICEILGGQTPERLRYEMFLDQHGQKISKSKGNGLSIEEWLAYAPPESLALYMFQKPRTAKKLYFDVLPRAVDEYLTFAEKTLNEAPEQLYENAAYHIHGGKIPNNLSPLSFTMLLNLAGVANTEDKNVMWGFISKYAPNASPAATPYLDQLVGYAIRYYQDHIKPTKNYRAPTDVERKALEDLQASLKNMPHNASAEDIQTIVYDVGKRHGFAELRQWFQAMYEVLLGQATGPRMGGFIALYGVDNTLKLMAEKLA